LQQGKDPGPGKALGLRETPEENPEKDLRKGSPDPKKDPRNRTSPFFVQSLAKSASTSTYVVHSETFTLLARTLIWYANTDMVIRLPFKLTLPSEKGRTLPYITTVNCIVL
jgi:hypothetical protein